MKNALTSRFSAAQAGGLRLIALTGLLATGLVPQMAFAAKSISLKGAASNLCLGVQGDSNVPRTPAQINTCKNAASQSWEFSAAGELRTLGGTRCLDVRGGSTAAQAVVQSYTCHGGDNQKWTLKPDGTIVGVKSGLCLTVMGGATKAGTGLDIWPCSNLAHQKWLSVDVSSAADDTQAPTPPSGLSIADLTCKSATLSWAKSTDNVGVTAYDVYRDGQLLTTTSGTASSAAIVLVPGAQWGLYVNARDAKGNVSQASLTLKTQVPVCVVDNQAPTTPANLTGSVSGTSVNLKWSPATDNISVSGYDIFRGDTKVGTSNGLGYTDSGLMPNTQYLYSVAARDAQSNVSSRSTGLTLVTGGACTSPVCSSVQVVAETDLPWGLLSLPDGNVLFSRRDLQDIVLLNPTTGSKISVGKVPDVMGTDGEGGLLGLAATAAFPATDPWLYIYHTTALDNRIVRVQYVKNRLDFSTLQVLLKGIPRNKFHNGGRLRFGPDGKLYAATGDAQASESAQDVNSLAGKILRLNPDGSRPSDNPFGNYVWTYGHRNPQGLAFDAEGRLWQQEFGDGNMDETNLLVKGGNYGWPNCEGTKSISGRGCSTPDFIVPKFTYSTAEGSCSGLAVVRGVLYVACLRGERMYRHVISGNSLINTQQLFVGTYGRMRTVEPTIDGALWLTTSNNGDKDNVTNNSDTKILKVILGN
jgi:glucose/arabinose dehydrogenase